jgi:hypothetical protein
MVQVALMCNSREQAAFERLTGATVVLRLITFILICSLLVACSGGAPGSSTSGINPGGRGAGAGGIGGGSSGGNSGGTGGGTTGGSGSGSGSGGSTAPTTPTAVSVSANQTTSGVDIAVVAPTGTNPNAIALGTVAAGASGGSASNTGGSIARGSTMTVLMFGAGLSASMTVGISGPNDLTISNQTSIQSTGTPPIPGIAFTLAATPSASLGARTVILQDTSNNVTTFTGGLQVTQ